MPVVDQADAGILLSSGTNEVEFLRFWIGESRYGINVSKVCQITQLENCKVTPVPNLPEIVVGIAYFREKPVTVIDLGKYLGAETAKGARPLLMFTEFNQYVCGFLIEGVHGVIRCGWSEFVPFDSRAAGQNIDAVVGSVTVDKEIHLILDFEVLVGNFVPSLNFDYYQAQIKPQGELDRSAVKILYCEDSHIVQSKMVKTLTNAGFGTIHAYNNGREGLKAIQKLPPGSVDIILTDIEMPCLDGLAFCKAVRELEAWKSVPVVFFSSMINDTMKLKCKSVGGNAAFPKPSVHELVDIVERAILGK